MRHPQRGTVAPSGHGLTDGRRPLFGGELVHEFANLAGDGVALRLGFGRLGHQADFLPLGFSSTRAGQRQVPTFPVIVVVVGGGGSPTVEVFVTVVVSSVSS